MTRRTSKYCPNGRCIYWIGQSSRAAKRWNNARRRAEVPAQITRQLEADGGDVAAPPRAKKIRKPFIIESLLVDEHGAPWWSSYWQRPHTWGRYARYRTRAQMEQAFRNLTRKAIRGAVWSAGYIYRMRLPDGSLLEP